MNARYLERDGYGLCAEEVDEQVMQRFLDGLDGFEQALSGYQQDGNSVASRPSSGSPPRRPRRTARPCGRAAARPGGAR